MHIMLTQKQLVQVTAAAQPRPFTSVPDCQVGSSDLLCACCLRGEGILNSEATEQTGRLHRWNLYLAITSAVPRYARSRVTSRHAYRKPSKAFNHANNAKHYF